MGMSHKLYCPVPTLAVAMKPPSSFKARTKVAQKHLNDISVQIHPNNNFRLWNPVATTVLRTAAPQPPDSHLGAIDGPETKIAQNRLEHISVPKINLILTVPM